MRYKLLTALMFFLGCTAPQVSKQAPQINTSEKEPGEETWHEIVHYSFKDVASGQYRILLQDVIVSKNDAMIRVYVNDEHHASVTVMGCGVDATEIQRVQSFVVGLKVEPHPIAFSRVINISFTSNDPNLTIDRVQLIYLSSR